MKKELKKLEKFARMFDTDIEIEVHNTWASNIPEKVIFVGPKLDEEEVEACEFVYNRLGMEVPVHPLVFAFIHELGHVMSAKTLSAEEIEEMLNEYDFQRAVLESEEDLTVSEFLYHYWQIRAEKLANNWAIEYLQSVEPVELVKITKMVFDLVETKKMKEMFDFNNFMREIAPSW